MEYKDHIEQIDAASRSFATVIEHADARTIVPSCPGWTLRDLAEHVIDIHRWARSKVIGGVENAEPPSDDADATSTTDLRTRFLVGASALVTTLRSTPPSAPCWTLYRPHVAATWARRQALETTIHLWDAAHATGGDATIPPDLAVDGVREVADDLAPRQIALRRQTPLTATIALRLPSVDATETTVLIGGSPDRIDATLEISPEDALLLLWKRRNLHETDARRSGSASAVRDVLAAELVP
jgi:uncharacterized protein (TIGR03083 family)